ncbi:MAG: minor capsid protein [Clostridia bacterium]|nr:minor capsid protein [Clostridia bacterium]
MNYYHRNSDETIKNIADAYEKAVENINKEVQRMFIKFIRDGELTTQQAIKLLNKKVTNKELDEIRELIKDIDDIDIKRYLMSRLNAPAYKARMTRLEALKERVYIECKRIADVETKASERQYIDTINQAYYRNMFDIQKGLELGFDFAAISNKTIEQILKNPWSGKHFSKRIWKNTDVLAEKLTEIVTSGLMSGKSYYQMANELEEYTEYGKYAAMRLIRTESTYMANMAEMESYREADIEKYFYVATLDLRTSEICRELDRKVFNVKDAEPGRNLPPMHPNCRSTTRAYLGADTLKGIQRRARDPVTGKTYPVPADMDYKAWYKKYVVDKYGQDQAKLMEKKIRNKASDKKQYEKYKEVLGKDLGAKTFDEFQDLKYNDVKKWEDVKGLYKYIKSNPGSDKTYYLVNKEIIILKEKGIVNKNIGTAVKPVPVDINRIDSHAHKQMIERGITVEHAKSYVNNAKVMFMQANKTKQTYYATDGASVIIVEGGILKTAFPSNWYDDGANAIMEVLSKHGK